MISHEHFIEQLLTEFPELQTEVLNETRAGLLHLETACFARHTQAAIDNHNVEVLQRCFCFAMRIFQDADADVKNAMYVSYLEHLNLENGKTQRAWALKMMPPLLKEGWIEIHKYLDDLFSKRNDKEADRA
jgi:hypothetical protein